MIQTKLKLKLKLYVGEPCLNNGKLEVKGSQYLGSNVNKHYGSYNPSASLKKIFRPILRKQKCCFILIFGTIGQKLHKIRYQHSSKNEEFH